MLKKHKRRKPPNLKEALAKLKRKSQGEQVQYIPTSSPTKYSDSDIKKARKVLDRLLISPINEVSSIRIVPRALQEREDSNGV